MEPQASSSSTGNNAGDLDSLLFAENAESHVAHQDSSFCMQQVAPPEVKTNIDMPSTSSTIQICSKNATELDPKERNSPTSLEVDESKDFESLDQDFQNMHQIMCELKFKCQIMEQQNMQLKATLMESQYYDAEGNPKVPLLMAEDRVLGRTPSKHPAPGQGSKENRKRKMRKALSRQLNDIKIRTDEMVLEDTKEEVEAKTFRSRMHCQRRKCTLCNETLPYYCLSVCGHVFCDSCIAKLASVENIEAVGLVTCKCGVPDNKPLFLRGLIPAAVFDLDEEKSEPDEQPAPKKVKRNNEGEWHDSARENDKSYHETYQDVQTISETMQKFDVENMREKNPKLYDEYHKLRCLYDTLKKENVVLRTHWTCSQFLDIDGAVKSEVLLRTVDSLPTVNRPPPSRKYLRYRKRQTMDVLRERVSTIRMELINSSDEESRQASIHETRYGRRRRLKNLNLIRCPECKERLPSFCLSICAHVFCDFCIAQFDGVEYIEEVETVMCKCGVQGNRPIRLLDLAPVTETALEESNELLDDKPKEEAEKMEVDAKEPEEGETKEKTESEETVEPKEKPKNKVVRD